MNYKQFKKSIETMKSGETVYINAINLSMRSIDELRSFIRIGALIPDEEWVKRSIVPEAVGKYMDGTCIAPQMEYRRF